MDFSFFLESALLGVGLAMDAFSVSIASGLHKPHMPKTEMMATAGTFAGFQIAMPMIGWICVHTIVELFSGFQKFIPWIALVLLLYIGITMLIGAFKKEDESDKPQKKRSLFATLMIQGIATSIDALSVGFTIASDTWNVALIRSLIIGIVTLAICLAGLIIGKKVGDKLSNKAEIVGAVILIGIGIEIWVRGVFFS